jgi:ATP-dependent Clp protease ATP-binding subunit ClpA
MKLLQRRRRPRARTIRPAERYLAAGAAEARRLGHAYVGTEHVLAVLCRDRGSGAVQALARLGVGAEAVESALARWLPQTPGPEKIDPQALAALGIDLDSVRDRLEQTFGAGALEQSRAGCLGISPRLKLALAHAIDETAGGPLDDRHVLLGMLAVTDSVAARVLAALGVFLEDARALLPPGGPR